MVRKTIEVPWVEQWTYKTIKRRGAGFSVVTERVKDQLIREVDHVALTEQLRQLGAKAEDVDRIILQVTREKLPQVEFRLTEPGFWKDQP